MTPIKTKYTNRFYVADHCNPLPAEVISNKYGSLIETT